MKKVIIISILVLFYNSLKAQSLNETIDYINDILKSSYHVAYWENQEMEKQYFYSISVDKNGMMTCKQFEKNSINKEIKEDRIYFKVYLKTIHTGKRNNYPNKDFHFSYYVNQLVCNGLDYCFIGLGVDRGDIYFMIESETDRDKLDNAFKHLIEFANNNKDYKEKDPFSN